MGKFVVVRPNLTQISDYGDYYWLTSKKLKVMSIVIKWIESYLCFQ